MVGKWHAFKKTGGRVISKSFEVKNPDFKTKISGIKGVEAVFVAGFANIVGSAIKQLRAEGYKGIILSHSGVSSLPLSMGEFNGVYLAAPIIYNTDYVFSRDAKERYEAKYKTLFSHQAANGYDIMKILAGLLDGNEISRENIRKLFENGFSYPGVFGFIEKKAGKNDFHFPLHPAMVVNGKILYLQDSL